jgi:hypothetical protein
MGCLDGGDERDNNLRPAVKLLIRPKSDRP